MAQIEHVFVLMLENRSFDHMLGYSAITGNDPETGAQTSVIGLSGSETNTAGGTTYSVSPSASFTIEVDPGHEFGQVVEQLCGPGAQFTPRQPYPPIDNSGFASSYGKVVAAKGKTTSPGEVMKGYSASNLPVLNALAKEFAVCDHWYASMPGATWPNRLFVHGASSNGLDHSPTKEEILGWETFDGFEFPNGDIFDRLHAKGLKRRLYAGDHFPMIAALKGIHLDDIRDYEEFGKDLAAPTYPYSYVFIEPSYDLQNDYKASTSQHPLGDVTRGESLIKTTYEAIRNSPLWESSVLILTWDEHGGFFDHVEPPAAVAPGDTKPGESHNQSGFTFEQYGVRVPAVVISPWIPKNTVDHRVYDHSSIPATLEALFDLAPLTERDKAANSVLPLLSLAAPRTDTPFPLPSPAVSFTRMARGALAVVHAVAEQTPLGPTVARPSDSINDGNLPVIVNSALRQDLDLSPASERPQIIAKVAALKTREDGANYIQSVQAKIAASRSTVPK